MRERVKDCRDGSHRYFAVVADRRWKFDLDATDWLVGHAGARCSQEDNAVDAMPVPPRPGLRERRGALGSNSATGPRLSPLYAYGDRGEPRRILAGLQSWYVSLSGRSH